MNYTETTSIGSTELSDEDFALLNKVNTWLKQTEGADSESVWLTEAEEDYAYYAGDQDSNEVLEALALAKRPALVYNQIKPKVDVVVGLAGQNRQLPSAFPVEKNDEALVELANGTIKFFRRESGLADNEMTCFEHTVKSGRSLLHFYVNDDNPYGDRDPLVDSANLLINACNYLFIEKMLQTLVIRCDDFIKLLTCYN